MASPLRFETVGAYADACFGHTKKLGPFTIGYRKPFVYDLMKDPKKDWKTDFTFGWQTVAGINPESITRVESEADLLAIKTLTVRTCVPPGISMESAKALCLFSCNFESGSGFAF